MFLGNARTTEAFGGTVYYHTRKDRRFIIWDHSCNPGKKHKQQYNRQIRNGKNKLRDLKNSQWKRLHCADLYNWC